MFLALREVRRDEDEDADGPPICLRKKGVRERKGVGGLGEWKGKELINSSLFAILSYTLASFRFLSGAQEERG